MIQIGIDPGISGALAVLDTETRQVKFYDTPTVTVRSGKKLKNQMDAAAITLLLNSIAVGKDVLVTIEKVNAMPGWKADPDRPGEGAGVYGCHFSIQFRLWLWRVDRIALGADGAVPADSPANMEARNDAGFRQREGRQPDQGDAVVSADRQRPQPKEASRTRRCTSLSRVGLEELHAHQGHRTRPGKGFRNHLFSEKDTMAKDKKEAAVKKSPRQQPLTGMEDSKIDALEEIALNYADLRDERMSIGKKEQELKQQLLALMKAQKREHYHRGTITIDIVHEKENLKVKVKAEMKTSRTSSGCATG